MVGQGDRLVEAGTWAEMVTELVVGRTEPGGCVEGAEPAQGVGVLLDSVVALHLSAVLPR